MFQEIKFEIKIKQIIVAGPKLGMFRVEIENPPEEIKSTPGVEFVEEQPETIGKFNWKFVL